MTIPTWLTSEYIEIFGAVAGIVYVFLEIRQTIWLWPVGIITSAVYILVFFTSKIYADMSLQGYYLAISCLGWYWWGKGTRVHRSFSEGGGHRAPASTEVLAGKAGHTASSEAFAEEEGAGQNKEGAIEEQTDEIPRQWKGDKEELQVTRLKLRTGVILLVVFVVLFLVMWLVLTKMTDSPVPVRDSFITSLSVIATWMLARKIYEHWYLWIVVNFVSAGLFLTRGLYPTVILYVVYGVMSFVGLVAWKKSISHRPVPFNSGK